MRSKIFLVLFLLLSTTFGYAQVMWQNATRNPDDLVLVGLAYLKEGDSQKAIDLAQVVLKKYPDYIDFRFILAQGYLSLSEYASSERLYKEILQQNPAYYDAYYGLAINLWKQKRYDESLAIWENVSEAIANVSYFKELNTTYQGEIEGERFKFAMDDVAQKVKSRLYPSAIHQLDSLLVLYPKDSQVHQLKAKVHLDNGDYEKAKASYYYLIKNNVDKEASYLKLSEMEAEKKNFDEASLLLDTLLVLNPGNELYKNLKTTYADNIHYERYVNLDQSFLKYDNTDDIFLLSSLGVGVEVKPKVTLIGQVNWGSFRNGRGFQYQLDNWSNYTKTIYAYASVGYSSSLIFPKWRAAYSLYKEYGGWLFDIGGRYMKPQTNAGIYTGVASLGRFVGANLFYVRTFWSTEGDRFEKAFSLSWRYYYNENKPETYFTVLGNIGTSPDDPERYQFYNNPDVFKSYSLGLGVRHRIKKYVLGGQGMWSSYKISDTKFLNEYNLTLSVKRFF